MWVRRGLRSAPPERLPNLVMLRTFQSRNFGGLRVNNAASPDIAEQVAKAKLPYSEFLLHGRGRNGSGTGPV